MDPAIGVHHILRDLLHDTVDGVSNVLLGGDQEAGRNQDNEGGLVVEPEDVVVNTYLIELYEALH